MPSSTKKINSTGGFTIMEVALAATVLALTLTGMIGVIESGSRMLDLSRKQTMASQILSDEIQQLRLQSWTTIVGYPTAATTMSVDPSFSSAANSNFTCSRTVSVLKNDNNGNPNLIFVQFTITWTTGFNGRTYTRTASTYVSNNGLMQAFHKS
jgi:Tfp pilus assembly protein PilV